MVGKDLIRFLLGPGWEEAGRIFALFGPGIGVMLLYNTHGWIHLSVNRPPERWLGWGLMEFVCTASLFVLALHWGPSGIALAWTISYFPLNVYQPLTGTPEKKADRNGHWVGIRSHVKMLRSISWAGVATALIIGAMPRLATPFSAASALVRMISVSCVFFALYLGGVIALHRGLKPLTDTLGLLRDLLQNDGLAPTFSEAVSTEGLAISAWRREVKSPADFSGDIASKP